MPRGHNHAPIRFVWVTLVIEEIMRTLAVASPSAEIHGSSIDQDPAHTPDLTIVQ